MNAPKQKLSDFADKDYRDGFLDAVTRSGIAYQIKALRKKFGFSQAEMAEATGKTQSVISRLEGGGRASVQTLLDIASALNVALLVRFVSYPEFLDRANKMSDKALQPDTIHESLAAPAVANDIGPPTAKIRLATIGQSASAEQVKTLAGALEGIGSAVEAHNLQVAGSNSHRFHSIASNIQSSANQSINSEFRQWN